VIREASNELLANLMRGPSAARGPRRPNRPLRVFKFGGTSVNGASCIQNVTAIVRRAARDADIVVVVSAMSGVTDKLLQAATAAEQRNRGARAKVLSDLRARHLETLAALVHSSERRAGVTRKMDELFALCDEACERATVAGELAPEERDLISGIGERLAAPLLAVALLEQGLASEPIEATKLIVTDAKHGAAEPVMGSSRVCCESRLTPLLAKGVVPVVTGFIGATPRNVPTTLGRGGSDYSASIVAAALNADDVVIWTDVDGFMTADPRVVPEARPLSEISYRQASELAFFGAKVLHPKTLDPLRSYGPCVWIRKTFAPDASGTKITPEGPHAKSGVTALASRGRVAFVELRGQAIALNRDMARRAVDAAVRVRPDSLLCGSSNTANEISFVVSDSCAAGLTEALLGEFERELANGSLREVRRRLDLGFVTAVGSRLDKIAGRAAESIRAMGIELIHASCSGDGSKLSLVVPFAALDRCVIALHRDLFDDEECKIRFGEHAGQPASCPSPRGSPNGLA
jgi:bifunctional aspartokinase / homoserine dehydrogenase 1